MSNPYAPPNARVEDSIDVGAAETARREHIAHETAVRAAGLLAVIGGTLMLLRGVWILVFGMTLPLSVMPLYPLIAPLLLVAGALSVAAGQGLLRLRAWARVPAVVLSAIGLIVGLFSARIGLRVAPLGALISGLFLFLLWAGKGRRLFAPDYAEIVAATPQVKYRTSILLWVTLTAVVAVSGALIVIGP